MNHFSCQFCRSTTDIGIKTRPLSNNNNSLLYWRGGRGGKREKKGEVEREEEREGGRERGERREERVRYRKERGGNEDFIIPSFLST